MTHGKNFAYDGKGAVAGNANPLPERDNADSLGQRTGIELADEEAIDIKEKLDQRDEKRWELNANSAQSEV